MLRAGAAAVVAEARVAGKVKSHAWAAWLFEGVPPEAAEPREGLGTGAPLVACGEPAEPAEGPGQRTRWPGPWRRAGSASSWLAQPVCPLANPFEALLVHDGHGRRPRLVGG
jgi:hypothetical protein